VGGSEPGGAQVVGVVEAALLSRDFVGVGVGRCVTVVRLCDGCGRSTDMSSSETSGCGGDSCPVVGDRKSCSRCMSSGMCSEVGIWSPSRGAGAPGPPGDDGASGSWGGGVGAPGTSVAGSE